ncbi:MAG TPA: transglycosylase SLT domain-containing protein [Burkholderiales bacterium]|nr:transglycosylase SLT domain-containing protein [Burkholderiales bacterium]
MMEARSLPAVMLLATAMLAPATAIAPPMSLAGFVPMPPPTMPEPTLDAAQEALVEHLARRYRVAVGPTGHIVRTAYRAAGRMNLDPLLVLAVISVESRFNPIAESGMGARGLMQIIPKYHLEKLAEHGGEGAVLDPESNILVGTRILREYVRRTGSLEAGLQFYNGAAWDETARYTRKVLAERERLARVVEPARAGI